MESCKFCFSDKFVKNGFVRGKQRYKCKHCFKSQVFGDERIKYPDYLKQVAITMYVNNCGIRRIGAILNIPFQYVSNWVLDAGQKIEQMVKEQPKESRNISILEMDELYTYVKKRQEKSEFGLLLIGTEMKLLRIK